MLKKEILKCRKIRIANVSTLRVSDVMLRTVFITTVTAIALQIR